MKFAYSDISGVFEWKEPFIPTLVIENQLLLRKLIGDIYLSLDGVQTKAVLSKKDTPIDFSKNAEVISDFINFNINQKNLLSKICSHLEHAAVSPENYLSTQQLLAQIESTAGEWAFDFPCDIVFSKISVQSILKGIGVEINDSYSGVSGDAERIIDYMELVREFDRDKLFVTVNMRSFFPDDVIEKFISTSVSHEYKVLMIESNSYPMLKNEKRLTVDSDLCEF